MFELPWHIDRPLPIALFLLLVTGLFLYLYFLFSKEDGRFRKAIEILLTKWSVNLPHEKKLSLCRGYLTTMVALFGYVSVLCFSVGLGIVKNKDIAPLTFEDIQDFERRMESQGLKKRFDLDLEQLWEERDATTAPQPKAAADHEDAATEP